VSTRGPTLSAMSLLLPQTRTGTVQSSRLLDIHGDRYVEVALALDDSGTTPVTGRVSATECPADLTPGERVRASFTMGVITRIVRD